MPFWDPRYFDLNDNTNAEIWANSPQLQQGIHPPIALAAAGAFGAQQAMIELGHQAVLGNRQPPGILPWVPDLAGRRWKKKDAVFIVGSAYAGFIKEYSGRTAAMNFCCYATANSASEFQERFFKDVVQPDSYYYGPLSALIEEMRVASQLCVFDLCRASLVKRGPALVGANGPIRNDSSKEAKGNVQLAIFNAYVAANAVWTGRRFTESAANRIIALGNLAAAQVRSTLVNLLDPGNRTEQDRYGNQLPPANHNLGYCIDHATWLQISGTVQGEKRHWWVLPVLHPARHNKPDPEYARTRQLLEVFLAR